MSVEWFITYINLESRDINWQYIHKISNLLKIEKLQKYFLINKYIILFISQQSAFSQIFFHRHLFLFSSFNSCVSFINSCNYILHDYVFLNWPFKLSILLKDIS